MDLQKFMNLQKVIKNKFTQLTNKNLRILSMYCGRFCVTINDGF